MQTGNTGVNQFLALASCIIDAKRSDGGLVVAEFSERFVELFGDLGTA